MALDLSPLELATLTLRPDGTCRLDAADPLPTFLFDVAAAPVPRELASNATAVRAGRIDREQHLAQYPMVFVAQDRGWALVKQALAWNYFFALAWEAFEAGTPAPWTIRVLVCRRPGAIDIPGYHAEDDGVYRYLRARLALPSTSRVTATRAAKIRCGKTCPACAAARGDGRPPAPPLTAVLGRGWKGPKGRGEPGEVHCETCGCVLALAADEYRRFYDEGLRTDRYCVAELAQGAPVPCGTCRAAGRRGVLLRRTYPDGQVVVACSHCPDSPLRRPA